MTIADYETYDGLGLADLVARKEVSPSELLEEAISRAEARNPTLNAIVFEAYDEARAVAAGDLPEGPFRGVPLVLKDIACPVKGWPYTHGSRFLAGNTSEADGPLVTRYREAGLVLMGQTNTPEFGITGTTEGAYFGVCRNPWNTDYSAGGSSGGAAAAVAAGILPMAHAADGLGSIRIPAACCGLFGMKTTRDRIPTSANDMGASVGMVVEHVVTRTVRDSAAMLDATGYPEGDEPFAFPAKARPYLEEIETPPRPLRIAFHCEMPSRRPVHPEIRDALEKTAKLLEDLGHHVEEQGLEIDYRRLYAAQTMVSGSNFAAMIDRAIARIGREPEPHEFEPLTWRNYKGSKKALTGAMAMEGWATMRSLGRDIMRVFNTYDVVLSPVMAQPVPEIGHVDPVNLEPAEVDSRQAAIYPFTPPYNFTGQPSMSVPVGTDSNGLPIGMMFSGRYADEATLFQLARQLEDAQPWTGRAPSA